MQPDEERLRVAFGQVIREARLAEEESQEELAHRAGLSRNHLGAIERGQMTPTIIVLYRLAAALDVTPAGLLDRADSKLSKS